MNDTNVLDYAIEMNKLLIVGTCYPSNWWVIQYKLKIEKLNK